MAGHEAALGDYRLCSLFSPVLQFVDQASACSTAEEVLKLLFHRHSPPHRICRAAACLDWADESRSDPHSSEPEQGQDNCRSRKLAAHGGRAAVHRPIRSAGRGHDALLFTLCARAQSLAARLVLQQAAGQHATASDEQRATLTLEATRETLRKLLLDWSQAFDGAPAAAEWDRTMARRTGPCPPCAAWPKPLSTAKTASTGCNAGKTAGRLGDSRQYRTGALAGHAGSGLAGLRLLPPLAADTLADTG
jgi:hypothetical protein